MEPLASKYPGWLPYVYGLDNPIRFIDSDGMLVDDYFSKTSGKPLGTDNAKTDNIRVIDENTFNSINTAYQFHYNASEDTKTQALQNSSELVQGSYYDGNVNELCAAGILNHYYSEAGFSISELKDKQIGIEKMREDVAMIAYGKDFDLEPNIFEIKVDKREFGDHIINKWDAINMFIHERGGHGPDYLKAEKKGQYPLYDEFRDETDWENRAVSIQKNHSSWIYTSKEWKDIFDK